MPVFSVPLRYKRASISHFFPTNYLQTPSPRDSSLLLSFSALLDVTIWNQDLVGRENKKILCIMGRIWKMNTSGSYSNSMDDKQANKQHKHPKLISCLLSAPLCCSSRGTGLHFPCHNSLGAPLQDLMRLSQPRDWRRQFFDLKNKRKEKEFSIRDEKTPQSCPAHSWVISLPLLSGCGAGARSFILRSVSCSQAMSIPWLNSLRGSALGSATSSAAAYGQL